MTDSAQDKPEHINVIGSEYLGSQGVSHALDMLAILERNGIQVPAHVLLEMAELATNQATNLVKDAVANPVELTDMVSARTQEVISSDKNDTSALEDNQVFILKYQMIRIDEDGNKRAAQYTEAEAIRVFGNEAFTRYWPEKGGAHQMTGKDSTYIFSMGREVADGNFNPKIESEKTQSIIAAQAAHELSIQAKKDLEAQKQHQEPEAKLGPNLQPM